MTRNRLVAAALALALAANAAAAPTPPGRGDKPLKPGETDATFELSTTLTGLGYKPPSWLARKSEPLVDATQIGILKAEEARKKLELRVRKAMTPKVKPVPTEKTMMGFERHGDLSWQTGGYALLAASREHATEGKTACRAEFFLAADLGQPKEDAFVPTMRIEYPPRGEETALPVTDWKKYKSFRADVWSAASQPISFRTVVTDRHSYRFEVLRILGPASGTTIEIPLADLGKERLDTAHIHMLEFSVDTAGLAERPVLYLDNLRFGLYPPPPPPPVTSTVLDESTATAFTDATATTTGRPKTR